MPLLHFARLAGVHVDVAWDPTTCTLTAMPAETPVERADREERRGRYDVAEAPGTLCPTCNVPDRVDA